MSSSDSGSAASKRPDEHLSAPGEGARIPALVRDHLGQELRNSYAVILAEEQPLHLLDLIARLDLALSKLDAAVASAFRANLLAALPGLRAFACSLAVNQAQADDLVQETLLKAWANQHRFQTGSNLMAWLCTILRNQFYTECRKRRREVEDAEGTMAAQLIAPAAQEHGVELQKIWTHLAKLPALQREALLLVAAQGMTYEAAAELVGCQVGTVKSRVSRARAFLASSLEMADSRISA
jgi:RNA polymerase sigma-70 factor, ECF subfamily